METSPEPTVNPLNTSESLSGGPTFGDKVTPKKHIVTINLASDEGSCSFWVGLFHPGDMTPHDICQLPTVEEMLQAAAVRGIADGGGPVMLTDTTHRVPRYVYLLPVFDGSHSLTPDIEEKLIDTVRNWSPHSVGIYLAPEICEKHGSQDLLQKLLSQFIQTSSTSEFNLLSGRHGMNTLLNTALKLKFDIEDEQVEIRVFH